MEKVRNTSESSSRDSRANLCQRFSLKRNISCNI